jgi:hypothetical protein
MVACGAATWHADVNSLYDDVTLQLVMSASTDDDVSPIDWPCLTATLTVNIFQTVTLFDDPFA